jgi:GGDEF domain-containing protein
MNHEPHLRPEPTLDMVHAELRDLYAREYPQGAPHLHQALLPGLPQYIGALVRRKLDLIVQEDVGEGRTHTDLAEWERNAVGLFLDMQVRRAHMEVGEDSTLSTNGHSIPHFNTQPPLVAHNLIKVASSENDARRLERMGCVFFDVDGMKTIVDCTSHAHGSRYLRALSHFLGHPSKEVAEWLEENRLRVEAFSVGGDEFMTILRSDDQPVTHGILAEFTQRMQSALALNTDISSIVSFDDPEFIMEYDQWSDEDRKRLKEDPEFMKTKLTESRSKLPDVFIPSVSCGSATFLEALHEALSPDTEEAKTLEELGLNTFHIMVAKADERMKTDKREFRSQITDPKLRAFLLRNAENRRLREKLQDTRQQLRTALDRIAVLEAESADDGVR